jgi:hypothetical protein
MYSVVKRAIDCVVAIVVLVALSPIGLILTIVNYINFGSPVLFSQQRPGRHEKIFRMFKFRTMTNEKDEHGELLPDDVRLTRWGKILRSTSLDELPELWNVVRGDMSFVGPRPLLVGYLPLYSQHQSRRHEVRPGITGLAQVNGRNQLSWPEKFDLDVQYVESVSFLLDLKILWKTITVTLKREGISHSDNETMPPFKGIQS